MKRIPILPALILSIAVCACHQGSGEGGSTVSGTDGESSTGAALIHVTREQFTSSGMEVGDPLWRTFSHHVHASGMVMAPPSGRAEVSTLIPGSIHGIYHSIGDRITKGAILVSLESNEFIALQQQYAEAAQRIRLLESEYKRQKSLFEQQVVAEKEFLKTESEYRSMLATMEGLKARLKMLYVDPEAVAQGTIRSYLEIRSPIEGYITGQELVMGQFINPGEVLVQVVNSGTLQLYLQVFDKDLAALKSGQAVVFFTPDQPDRQFVATLLQPGKSIDEVSKTVPCLARIEPPDLPRLVNNLYVEANIITTKREALSVPEEALVTREGNTYLLTLAGESEVELMFRLTEVQPGVVMDGFVEIPEQDIRQVLLRGAFQLNAAE